MDVKQIAALLVDPHRTLWVEAADEASLLARLATFGSLPQADLLEPWEPDGLWRARAHVPNADPARCLQVGTLRHGVSPGRLEWLDCGRIGIEEIQLGEVTATCYFDHEGGQLTPDLVRHAEVDSAGFAEGVPDLPVWVEAVSHRETGRPGLRFTAQIPDLEPDSERRAVIGAARRTEPMASDMLWWMELGRLVVVGWRLQEARSTLPPDPGAPDFPPFRGERCELQVWLPAGEHDDAVLELAAYLGDRGLIGSRARWIGTDFVACWEGAYADVPIDLPHRWVPACPDGLEERWQGIDPRWWPGHLVRFRCGLADRDLLPQLSPRDADDIDHQIADTLPGMLDPVQADVPALRWVFPTLPAREWTAWIEMFGALDHPELAGVHYVAMGEQTTVLIRRRATPAAVPWAPHRPS